MLNPFDELAAQIQEIKTLLTQNAGNGIIQPTEQPVTTEELCKFLQISEPSLARLKARGKIPYLQLGGLIRYDKAAVVKALEKKEKII